MQLSFLPTEFQRWNSGRGRELKIEEGRELKLMDMLSSA
jgi:hypothetical protein